MPPCQLSIKKRIRKEYRQTQRLSSRLFAPNMSELPPVSTSSEPMVRSTPPPAASMLVSCSLPMPNRPCLRCGLGLWLCSGDQRAACGGPAPPRLRVRSCVDDWCIIAPWCDDPSRSIASLPPCLSPSSTLRLAHATGGSEPLPLAETARIPRTCLEQQHTCPYQILVTTKSTNMAITRLHTYPEAYNPKGVGKGGYLVLERHSDRQATCRPIHTRTPAQARTHTQGNMHLH